MGGDGELRPATLGNALALVASSDRAFFQLNKENSRCARRSRRAILPLTVTTGTGCNVSPRLPCVALITRKLLNTGEAPQRRENRVWPEPAGDCENAPFLF